MPPAWALGAFLLPLPSISLPIQKGNAGEKFAIKAAMSGKWSTLGDAARIFSAERNAEKIKSYAEDKALHYDLRVIFVQNVERRMSSGEGKGLDNLLCRSKKYLLILNFFCA